MVAAVEGMDDERELFHVNHLTRRINQLRIFNHETSVLKHITIDDTFCAIQSENCNHMLEITQNRST